MCFVFPNSLPDMSMSALEGRVDARGGAMTKELSRRRDGEHGHTGGGLFI